MTTKSSSLSAFERLEVFDTTSDALNVIIDTPAGSRNKYKYDERYGLFTLHSILPLGIVFPFNFGYVPSTLGGDGDPLDVLVLLDVEAFVGCLIPSRLIGVIEAEQTVNGETMQNHRLIAVATVSPYHRDIHALNQIDKKVIDEIEHFFISYTSMRGKLFTPTGRANGERAKQLVDEGMARYKQQK
ncbi:MAG: inorganic diphosphatase [Ktedonobacteraceae bacterium]